jgi:hypothetical protein
MSSNPLLAYISASVKVDTTMQLKNLKSKMPVGLL